MESLSSFCNVWKLYYVWGVPRYFYSFSLYPAPRTRLLGEYSLAYGTDGSPWRVKQYGQRVLAYGDNSGFLLDTGAQEIVGKTLVGLVLSGMSLCSMH
jgi:hypothetical protein